MTALAVAAAAVLVGRLWMLAADRLLVQAVHRYPSSAWLHSAKGWLCALVAWVVLWPLMRVWERHLRHDVARYRGLVEGQGEGVILTDPDGRLAYANPAAHELLGLPPGALVGRRFDDVVALDETEETPGPAAPRPRGSWSTNHVEVRRPDGGDRTLLCTGAPQTDHRGRLVGTVCVLRDVTEFRRAELEHERQIAELREAVAQVQALHGLLPICANCKKVRDDSGSWYTVETFVHEHSQAEFTHTLCPDCMASLYPEYAEHHEA